jgi:hypothetical protein
MTKRGYWSLIIGMSTLVFGCTKTDGVDRQGHASRAVPTASESRALASPSLPAKEDVRPRVTPIASLTPRTGLRRALPSPARREAKATTTIAPATPFKGRKIALVHTANMIGEIEPCG